MKVNLLGCLRSIGAFLLLLYVLAVSTFALVSQIRSIRKAESGIEVLTLTSEQQNQLQYYVYFDTIDKKELTIEALLNWSYNQGFEVAVFTEGINYRGSSGQESFSVWIACKDQSCKEILQNFQQKFYLTFPCLFRLCLSAWSVPLGPSIFQVSL